MSNLTQEQQAKVRELLDENRVEAARLLAATYELQNKQQAQQQSS